MTTWENEKSIEKLNIMLLHHEKNTVAWWNSKEDVEKKAELKWEKSRSEILQYVKKLLEDKLTDI